MTIALVAVIFSFLVFVHELGHFLAARINGVEVEEFGFGFPPRLIGKWVGRTLYSINLLPFGGFVRLKGEDGHDRQPGSFGAASVWAKTKIMFAGVAMNGLTAYLILVGLCLTGLPPVIDNQFTTGHPVYAQPRQVIAANVAKDSPAERVGLKSGDLIVSGDGQSFTTEEQLVKFTREYAGQTVSFATVRGQQQRTVSVKLNPPDAKNGFLGVTPTVIYRLRYNFSESLLVAAGLLGQLALATVVGIVGFFAGLPKITMALLSHGTPATNVAGAVGAVGILSKLALLGPSFVLLFVAAISISLMVFNVFPIPVLDGGRWLVLMLQSKLGRRFSERVEAWLAGTSYALIAWILVVVTVSDIKNLRIH